MRGRRRSSKWLVLALGLTISGCMEQSHAKAHQQPTARFSPSYLRKHNVVLQGALVFRLADIPDPLPNITYYEVVWRLNRDPCSSHRAELKRHGVPDNCGQFGIGIDTRMDLDNFAKLSAEPSKTRPPGVCVSSTIEGGSAEALPDLDNPKIGEPIKASIRPVDPEPSNGKLPKYGRTFISHPTLTNGDYAHAGKAMRDALASIGCQ